MSTTTVFNNLKNVFGSGISPIFYELKAQGMKEEEFEMMVAQIVCKENMEKLIKQWADQYTQYNPGK